MSRSTRAVVEDHVEARRQGDLDGDLARNYSPEVVLLSAEGVHRGHDGVRTLADVLQRYAKGAPYDIRAVHVADDYALEIWSAATSHRQIHDGTDSFVVRDGRIVAQTIHFSVDVRSERTDTIPP